MTVSTIDPVVALVVIDLQEGLRDAPTVHPLPDVVARSAELADAFRDRGLPVVLVTAGGRPPGRTERAPRRGSAPLPEGFDRVLDELHTRPSDVRIGKQTWGAFTGTGLDAELRARDVTQVVITGVATSAGVESTARSAHEHGYHVVLATDAMTDTDQTAHEHSIATIFPKLGETAMTTEILAALST
ncbi:isochorismatase family protein [Jatrophihabitans endophyticus]|uniref:isochorismatase family protein n=1 Tax=Jatrophihabitans endophyticus TaxID=1206085 RepID=UPI0019F2245E|nr:isochorismatase family protein [Jatrophihabitans endophyticus]MBE7189583.1 isochorismatase family protein [Jatrophihabitans endophyticus]